MPSHIKALIVILFLATVVFALSKKTASTSACLPGDFDRRRNLWFGITLTVFLAHNFWIYICFAGLLLFFFVPKEKNRLAMYYFILFAAPNIQAEISGMGVIQHFFTIHYLRLLALAILLPEFLRLINEPDTDKFGSSIADKLIIGYLTLQFGLLLSIGTFTSTLRSGVFYSFIDVFLPYYVASRSLKTIKQYRDAITAFVVATLVLSAIGVFESSRRWLLYAAVENALGVSWGYGGYLMRGTEGLRAQASTGQPIPMGFAMAVALGFHLYLGKSVISMKMWILGLFSLIAGLISPLSRGPWIGAATVVFVYAVAGAQPVKRLVQLGVVGGIIFSALLFTPFGDKLISLLPFVGTVDEVTVSYRQRLLEIGTELVLQNPFFGAYGFFLAPEMQELKQGNGMIDLVNTYLAVALGSGLVGLSLFVGFFVSVAAGIYRAMNKLADKNSEEYVLGQSLLSITLGMMVIIFTVSSITVIPVIYWSVAGMGVAYAKSLIPRTLAGSSKIMPGVKEPDGFPEGAKLNPGHSAP
jgi:O-antigen ligase